MTNRTTRRADARAAARPPARTIEVELTEGPFAGWRCTARADFPASVLEQLQSDQIADIVGAFDRIVIDHNFPNEHDDVATSMGEVDPYDGLLAVVGEVFDRLGTLPPR